MLASSQMCWYAPLPNGAYSDDKKEGQGLCTWANGDVRLFKYQKLGQNSKVVFELRPQYFPLPAKYYMQ